MVDIKLVINNPKNGRSFQQEIKDDISKQFLGKKIGDKIKGELLDYTGYEFEIKGGSDKSGFPMRRDVDGSAKKKILAVEGVGLKRKTSKTKKGLMRFKGIKQRKTVAGNTIGQNTSQINLMIIKEGKEKISQLEAEEKPEVKEEAKAEEKPEAKAEEKKPELKEKPKAEEKPEVKEEAKAEEKKPEAKEEAKADEKPEVKEKAKAEEKPEVKEEAKAEEKPE
ncbi:MAG: S6e family ribosomal protein, partial [Candidatus Woesearchaeota archaeon]